MTEEILVVGKENCIKCETVKGVFKENNVQFKYTKMEDLPQETQKEYRKMAILKRQLEMPIVFKNGEIVDYREVI